MCLPIHFPSLAIRVLASRGQRLCHFIIAESPCLTAASEALPELNKYLWVEQIDYLDRSSVSKESMLARNVIHTITRNSNNHIPRQDYHHFKNGEIQIQTGQVHFVGSKV